MRGNKAWERAAVIFAVLALVVCLPVAVLALLDGQYGWGIFFSAFSGIFIRYLVEANKKPPLQ